LTAVGRDRGKTDGQRVGRDQGPPTNNRTADGHTHIHTHIQTGALSGVNLYNVMFTAINVIL